MVEIQTSEKKNHKRAKKNMVVSFDGHIVHIQVGKVQVFLSFASVSLILPLMAK